MPEQGLWLDADGNGFTEPPLPRGAEIWDQYGPPTSRFVYPVVGGVPYSYPQRALPWVEDPAQYHQYAVIGDPTDLRAAYDRSTDAELRQNIDALVDIHYFGWDRQIWVGTVAPAFGEPGGASMLTLSLPVSYLLRLGILQEIRPTVGSTGR
ncbi:glycohydrolase toxin TNT-related protein [Orlajensenia leifsoniae]|uniref:DUF4237 domain-containing protein n=1 Tax=Orlajensenia leifsoniae TaxID=2561933 RepID=A0A4Y9QXN4_9MICO|nr:glycohydrolase toxin TNT-related protein [Leifsonia flava]TFV96638.1 DUF4237 domain-containing protein [Leifsonia flava]